MGYAQTADGPLAVSLVARDNVGRDGLSQRAAIRTQSLRGTQQLQRLAEVFGRVAVVTAEGGHDLAPQPEARLLPGLRFKVPQDLSSRSALGAPIRHLRDGAIPEMPVTIFLAVGPGYVEVV